MNYEVFAAAYEAERKIIEARIKKLFKKKTLTTLYDPAAYVMESGGKRLRPALVLFSAMAVGGDKKHAYNPAIAVEMLHNFTLVHDDIMDNSALRRGRATLHTIHDVNTAILVGDVLLAASYEVLLDSIDHTIAKNTVSAFNTGLIEVCEGQSLDKEFERRNNVSIPEYYTMISKKTAALLQTCCKVGALVGGGSPAEVKALASYGTNIGIAFQLQDDLLDLMGDELSLGKRIGGDIIEGKKTFLILKALEKAKGKDLKILKEFIKNKGAKEEDIPLFRAMFEKLGVISDTEKEVKKFTAKGLRSLKPLRTKDAIDFFTCLANSLLKRVK